MPSYSRPLWATFGNVQGDLIMTAHPIGIGVIGAGFISGIYLTNLTTR